MEDGERAGWAAKLTCDVCSLVVRTAGAGLRRQADVAVMQRPPTSGISTILPASRSSTGLTSGASLSSARCVRAR